MSPSISSRSWLHGPLVFICHEFRQKEVHGLAIRLKRAGIHAVYSEESRNEANQEAWLEGHVQDADFILIVCSEALFDPLNTDESDPGFPKGTGLGSVMMIARSDESKIILVCFGAEGAKFVPSSFRERRIYDVSTESGYESLLSFLKSSQPRQLESNGVTKKRTSATPKNQLGELHGVPDLPEPYIQRNLFKEMKELLTYEPVGNSTRLHQIYGSAGVGKTVLATALAHDQSVRRAFADGIFWVNGNKFDKSVESLTDRLAKELRVTRETLRKRLLGQVLVIIDDASPDDLRGISGWIPKGRTLVTTRTLFPSHIGATLHSLDAFTNSETRQVLTMWSGKSTEDDLPPEAMEIATLCRNEPALLKTVADALRENTEPEAWPKMLQELERINAQVESSTSPHSLITKYLANLRDAAQRLEANTQIRAKQQMVTFASDSDEGEDRLEIKKDVEAFSAVLSLKDLKPPLCVGIFGDWGTGKSFFMKKMQERISLLCKKSEAAEKDGKNTVFCSRIAPITFNAWHYVDANLWASIACRIFEGLDEFINKNSTSPEDKKKQLFKQLETAKEKLKEAETVSNAAIEDVAAAEQKLTDLQKEKQDKTLELAKVRDEALKAAIKGSPDIQQQLQNAANEIGLQRLAGNVGELQQVLKEFRSARGRIKAMFLVLVYGKDHWLRIGLLVATLVLIPLFGFGVEWLWSYLKATGAVAEFSKIIVQAGAIVAGITTWLVNTLRATTKVIDKVEEASEQAEDVLQAARATPTPLEVELEKHLVLLKEREVVARATFKEAQQKVAEAEKEKKQLEEGVNGKALAEFIRDRLRGSNYQSQLGIISTLRKDLHSLSELLAASQQFRNEETNKDSTEGKDPLLPQVDRIILYIDDLDRCPEKTVVEVLQAVHLLLAFPLFIVVIGVDSRWLMHSLRQHHAALRTMDRDGSTDTSHYTTNPQNYLEKIIQVPFNLRRMDEDGFRRLVEDILPCDEEEVSQETPETRTIARAEQQIRKSPTPLQPAPRQDDSTSHISTTPIGNRADETPQVTSPEDFDLAPEALKVTRRELEFMAKTISLIPTPRAAKRLVNVYRLIRASVPHSEMSKFLGDEKTPGEYVKVMTLLAIQVGSPLSANDLFGWLRKTGSPQHHEEVKKWLDQFHRSEEGKRLTHCMHALLDEQKIGIANCIEWVNPVSRYSFRAIEQEESSQIRDEPKNPSGNRKD